MVNLDENKFLQQLHYFLFESQWERIDEKALERCARVESVETTEDGVWLIKDIMDHCGGVLDIFGPAECLFADMSDYFNRSMPEGKNYTDSMLRSYMPKADLLQNFEKDLLRTMIEVIDDKLCRLLMEFFSAKVERALAGTYEIVSESVYDYLTKVIKNDIEKPLCMIEVKLTKSEWSEIDCEKALEEFLSFWKFTGDSYDEEIKQSLKEYITESFKNRRSKIAYEAFLQINQLYLTLDRILLHYQYIFNTFATAEFFFEKAERELFGFSELFDSPKFETFIRLIHDNNKKYLFVKDVKIEIGKLLKKKKRQLPKDLLKLETKTDIEEGRYLVMSYERFTRFLKKLNLNKEDITLVNIEVKRSRHLTCPIVSPYGPECKPVTDSISELFGVLTIELQVWQRIRPEQLKKLTNIVETILFQLIDVTQSYKYLISTVYVERLAAYLRRRVNEDLLVDCEIPLTHVESFDNKLKILTWYLLYEEVIDNWKLDTLFPFAFRAVDIIFVKHADFCEPKLLTRLELTMLVQECIILCILVNEPMMLHWLGLCHLVREHSCHCHMVQIEKRVCYEIKPIIRSEYEFQMKFDYFENEDVCYASLVDRKSRMKLVTRDMARSFIFQMLLHVMPPSGRTIIKSLVLKNTKPKWEKESMTNNFYLTDKELIALSSDIVQKYKAALKKEWEDGPIGDLKVGKSEVRIFGECVVGLEDWMKLANRRIENATSFSEFAPNRTFYLQFIHLINPKTGEKEEFVDSGEFLETVKIVLNQNKEIDFNSDWDYFEKLTKKWFSDDEWIYVPIHKVLKSLRTLSVNPERFHFVPDINSFFWRVVLNGDRDLKSLEAAHQAKYDTVLKKHQKASDNLERLSQEIKSAQKKIDATSRKVERQHKTQEKRIKNLHRDLDRQKSEAERRQELDEKKLKEQEEAMRKAAMENEKEQKKMTEKLKSKEMEIKQLKKEIASRPNHIDPIFTQKMKEKDEEILKLKIKINQQNLENENRMKVSNNNHQILYQSIRFDLVKCREDKQAVERQLAEATARIVDLEKKFSVNLQESHAAQRLEQFTGEYHCLQNKLHLERIQNDAIQRKNEVLMKHIEEVEALLATRAPPSASPLSLPLAQKGPSTSGSSSFNSSSSIPDAYPNRKSKPSSRECGICLNEIKNMKHTTKCNACKTQWHSFCINEWISKNPTCPICRSDFPNARQFPPSRMN